MATQEAQVSESMGKSKSEYLLDSEEEVSRLSNQHLVIKDAMGGELVHAPLDHAAAPLRILDSGTSDGTWVVDFNEATRGQHKIVGTDIQDKDFPKDVPANIEYFAQNINEEWPTKYKDYFDLVHQRLTMVGAGPHWQTALNRLADMVKPGGWIQLIESENTLPSQSENPAMYDFVKLMSGIFGVMGAPLTLADDMPAWLADHGFENIHKKQLNIHQGHNNPVPELAKRGLYSNVVAANGLVQFANTLPDPPLPKERLGTIVADLKQELSDKGAIFPLRLIWAQKKA